MCKGFLFEKTYSFQLYPVKILREFSNAYTKGWWLGKEKTVPHSISVCSPNKFFRWLLQYVKQAFAFFFCVTFLWLYIDIFADGSFPSSRFPSSRYLEYSVAGFEYCIICSLLFLKIVFGIRVNNVTPENAKRLIFSLIIVRRGSKT